MLINEERIIVKKEEKKKRKFKNKQKKIKDKRKILEHLQKPCNRDEEKSILNFQFYLLNSNMCSRSIQKELENVIRHKINTFRKIPIKQNRLFVAKN